MRILTLALLTAFFATGAVFRTFRPARQVLIDIGGRYCRSISASMACNS